MTRSACLAPRAALYLRPDGQAHACCASGHAVGKVTGPGRQTLREIWGGAALAAQRHALDEGDFRFGCQQCGVDIAAGDRAGSLAATFDRYARPTPATGPRHLDLALSNRCNLRCVMCHGGLSSAIRSQREHLPPLPSAYDDAFFAELDELLPGVERMHFKGGEPFLAHENRRIWDALIAQGLRPEIAVTTNGTIWNDSVAAYVEHLRMEPIVSVDALDPDRLEAIRVGVDARELWANIDRFQALAEASGTGLTLTLCAMASTWDQVLPFLVEVDRRGANPNVVFVHHPSRFDLFGLPRAELEAIHRAWGADDTSFGSAVVRATWDDVRGRLASRLERPVEVRVQAPQVTPPPAPGRPALDEPSQDRLAAELELESGRRPLLVDVAGGVVDRIDGPAWATWLGVHRWPGTALDDLEGLIADESGGSVIVGPMPSERPGVDQMVLAVDRAAGRSSLAVHLFHDRDTGHQRLMIVPDRDPGGPT